MFKTYRVAALCAAIAFVLSIVRPAAADTILNMEGITAYANVGFYKTNTYTESGFQFDNTFRNSSSNDEIVSWTSLSTAYTGSQALLGNYGGAETIAMTSTTATPFTVLRLDLAETFNGSGAFSGVLTGCARTRRW